MKNPSPKAIGYHLLLINAFVYISLSLYTPFQSPYFTTQGITSFQIGVLLTIGPIASIFIQPLWAMISDRTGRRKNVLALVVLGSALALFSYYLGNTFLTFFIATMMLSIFSTSIIPLSDAIIIQEASKTNFDFAKIRMGGTLGFALFAVLAGNVIKSKPNSLFLLGFFGYLVLLIIVLRLPITETYHKRDKSQRKLHRNILKDASQFMNIFNTKMILFVLAFAFISQIGLSFYWSFLGVYLVDLGQSQSTVGIINSISALSEVPTLLFINRLLKKFSAMKILFISCVILSIRLFLVSRGNIAFVYLSQMLHGISYMTIYFSCAMFINENVKPGKQSQGQSTLAIMQMGVGSIVGNIVGGYLVDLLGIQSAYALMAVVIFLSAITILIIKTLFNRRFISLS